MSHRVVHLDDIESIPGPGTLTWRPVRATLGLRAFATSTYVFIPDVATHRHAVAEEPGKRANFSDHRTSGRSRSW